MGIQLPANSQDHRVSDFAIATLLEILGTERMNQLAILIAEVSTDTGFGDVKIVIVEGRVELLKAEKSYK